MTAKPSGKRVANKPLISVPLRLHGSLLRFYQTWAAFAGVPVEHAISLVLAQHVMGAIKIGQDKAAAEAKAKP